MDPLDTMGRLADSQAEGPAPSGTSLFLPTFLQRLGDPGVHTVLLCGCGGGFDFVHSLMLYPELRRVGKSVVIGSYSFGDPKRITGDAEVVFDEAGAIAKRVTAASTPDPYYGPEVHACSYLDTIEPAYAPHSVYAYYARAFSVPLLTRLYSRLVAVHAVDAVVLVDGGSDSLMVGDENGLGDPIEDAVSVTTVAGLAGLKVRVLISVGLGADRFNDVSDASSLRAVAELTRAGGFLGAVAVETASAGFALYRGCLEHIYQRQGFRSVLSGSIVSAAEGWFGSATVPPIVGRRVEPGQLFLWPLMAVLWGFDVEAVARRSLIARWIVDCPSFAACHDAFFTGRAELGKGIRPVENLPRHEDISPFTSPYSARPDPET
jgi:hypothetical protein